MIRHSLVKFEKSEIRGVEKIGLTFCEKKLNIYTLLACMWSKSDLSRAVNLLISCALNANFNYTFRYESIRGGAALAARRLSNTDSEQTRNELFHSNDIVNYSLWRLAGSFLAFYISRILFRGSHINCYSQAIFLSPNQDWMKNEKKHTRFIFNKIFNKTHSIKKKKKKKTLLVSDVFDVS